MHIQIYGHPLSVSDGRKDRRRLAVPTHMLAFSGNDTDISQMTQTNVQNGNIINIRLLNAHSTQSHNNNLSI
jgi:hypothetical protein